MKTQVTLTIDADIKKKFQAIAKEMGSNMSSLTNMYYAHVIETGHIDYVIKNDDIWQELYREYFDADKDLKENIYSIPSNIKEKALFLK